MEELKLIFCEVFVAIGQRGSSLAIARSSHRKTLKITTQGRQHSKSFFVMLQFSLTLFIFYVWEFLARGCELLPPTPRMEISHRSELSSLASREQAWPLSCSRDFYTLEARNFSSADLFDFSVLPPPLLLAL